MGARAGDKFEWRSWRHGVRVSRCSLQSLFATDAFGALQWILGSHLLKQGNGFGQETRTPTSGTGLESPEESESPAMSTQQGCRFENGQHLLPVLETASEEHQQETVATVEARFSANTEAFCFRHTKAECFALSAITPRRVAKRKRSAYAYSCRVRRATRSRNCRRESARSQSLWCFRAGVSSGG